MLRQVKDPNNGVTCNMVWNHHYVCLWHGSWWYKLTRLQTSSIQTQPSFKESIFHLTSSVCSSSVLSARCMVCQKAMFLCCLTTFSKYTKNAFCNGTIVLILQRVQLGCEITNALENKKIEKTYCVSSLEKKNVEKTYCVSSSRTAPIAPQNTRIHSDLHIVSKSTKNPCECACPDIWVSRASLSAIDVKSDISIFSEHDFPTFGTPVLMQQV